MRSDDPRVDGERIRKLTSVSEVLAFNPVRGLLRVSENQAKQPNDLAQKIGPAPATLSGTSWVRTSHSIPHSVLVVA